MSSTQTFLIVLFRSVDCVITAAEMIPFFPSPLPHYISPLITVQPPSQKDKSKV